LASWPSSRLHLHDGYPADDEPETAAGHPDKALILPHAIPFLSYIGIAPGAAWPAAAYGLFTEDPWGWSVAVTAHGSDHHGWVVQLRTNAWLAKLSPHGMLCAMCI